MASRQPTGLGSTGPGCGSLLEHVWALLGGRPVVSPAVATALRARRDALAALEGSGGTGA